jgi:hypothetical protein
LIGKKLTNRPYQILYDNLVGKVQLQLRQLADMKLSLKTNEFIQTGLTEEEKKYVTVDEKGKHHENCRIQQTAQRKADGI